MFLLWRYLFIIVTLKRFEYLFSEGDNMKYLNITPIHNRK